MRLEGQPKPYARARTSRGHMYLPVKYRLWREQAATQARLSGETWGDTPVTIEVTVSTGGLDITITPCTPARPKGLRGDLDNYLKAALDAIVDAGVIDDDRQVMAAAVTFQP